jgi:hypothetical protein
LRVQFPKLSDADERLLLDGYEQGRIEGFRRAMRLVAERHREAAPSAVTLAAVACLMAHLKVRKGTGIQRH